MKTLLTILLLFPAICFAQLRRTYPSKVQSLHVKHERQKRATHVAVAMAVTFAIAEIGNQTNNKAMWDYGNAATMAIGLTGIVYVIKINDNDLQKQRRRVQLLHRRKVQVHARR